MADAEADHGELEGAAEDQPEEAEPEAETAQPKKIMLPPPRPICKVRTAVAKSPKDPTGKAKGPLIRKY
jgi:hypothetical protein